jgi:hypothetical protein
LQAVKDVPAIKYWEICPLDQLLACLAADNSSKVGRRVVQLLFKSFFPLEQVPVFVKFRRV